MILKPGVRPKGIRPEVVLALAIAQEVYRQHGYPLVITSLDDSDHRTNSLHYCGCAADIRTKFITTDRQKRAIAADIRAACGQDYDVILESVGTDNEHIHVEFQPKER